MSNKIVQMMINNKVIEESEREIYSFGLRLLSETLFSFFCFILISLLFNKVIETLIFIISFALIRQFAGGYHAKRFVSCLLISCSIVLIFDLSLSFISNNIFILLAFIVASILLILILSPVDSIYKPLDLKDKKKYKYYMILVLGVQAVIAVVLVLFLDIYYSTCIIYSWFVLSILLIMGKLQNRKYNI